MENYRPLHLVSSLRNSILSERKNLYTALVLFRTDVEVVT